MASEYVKISASENLFGQKNLLHSQLELLDLIKRIQNFKIARYEEFVLKVALKTKIRETIVIIEELDKILPVSHYKIEYEEKERKKKETKEKHIYSLQSEIEEVQAKLARLQGEM